MNIAKYLVILVYIGRSRLMINACLAKSKILSLFYRTFETKQTKPSNAVRIWGYSATPPRLSVTPRTRSLHELKKDSTIFISANS